MDDKTMQHLIEKAKEAAKNAYAKYSNFPVGACLITQEKKIFTGCNVENISFGLTNCAERTAIFKAISEGYKTIDTIVIYTPTLKPTPPCGACRQVIAEFGNTDTRIVSICDSEITIDSNIHDLLPENNFPDELEDKN